MQKQILYMNSAVPDKVDITAFVMQKDPQGSGACLNNIILLENFLFFMIYNLFHS